MKKLTRVVGMILVVCILLCGCSKKDDSDYKKIIVTTSLEGKTMLVGDSKTISFPLVNAPTSMNVLISTSREYTPEEIEDVYVWKMYEQMTGVNVNWTPVIKGERAATVDNALVLNTPLDLIMRCKISAQRLTQYGNAGKIIDLAKDGLLEKYAPNCWAFLQKHPETLASITTPEGNIYSLPQVNSGAELRVSRKIFINKTWLEELDIDIPTTTEEFYLMLKAFKENDPNGNDKADEIPFCPADWVSVQDSFYGAFGLGNRGVHNLTVDAGHDGKARYIATSDEYKAFLQYFNKLYSEGLIADDMFTGDDKTKMTSAQWNYNISNNLIGVFTNTNLAGVPAEMTSNWVAIEEALEGPTLQTFNSETNQMEDVNYKMWTAVRANFHSEGAAVIPSTCTNPALVLKWLDYFWTDEGTLFYHMGIEGETFEVKADGTYDYTDKIYNELTGDQKFDTVVSKYSPYPGGSNPTVEIAPYFMGGEMAPVPAAAARALFEYKTTEFWPSFTFTTTELAEITAANNVISIHLDDDRVGFITGTKSFDEWEAYKTRITSEGLAKILVNYQKAIDRYYASKD